MQFRRHLLTVVLGIGLSGSQGAGEPVQKESASPALTHSRVTRLDITSRETAFGGRSFGAVGAYEILLGTATAVADPGAPLNAGIVDLENAPRNADGLVEYTFEVDILKPVDITRGNDVLVYEINNRGRNIVLGYFHEAGRGYAAENAGSAFLMNQGYTYVSSGWLHGAPGAGNPRPVLATLPLAMDNGRTITGASMEEWQNPDGAAFGRLTYPAVTLEKTAATLTHRQLQNDPRQTVPADQWYYVDDMTVAVTPPAGTDAGTIYEFVYEARNPIVHGLGFGAMRDFVSFARYSPADDRGAPNPLFADGMPVLDHVVAVGSSQSGRMARDFVYQGFNEDAEGRRLFDGMTPYVAGARRTFVNARFAQTGRYTRQHEDHNYPMDEFPFTFATTTDPLTGRTDGLLAACTASSTCPNIIQVDADSEYYGAHASLILTDTSGQALELPPNARYWMLATAHLQGNAGCRDPANPVRPWPYYRAAFDAMVQWVQNGVEPPATRAPSVADGTAVTVEEQGEQYPTIPDRPYNPTISELGVRDFSVWPPQESEERYPLFVPNLDADGNLVTGVMVPEVAAPLATMGKAIRAAGFAEGDLCGVNGSRIPFPRTEDARMELGDSRLSLEERYPGGEAEYVKRYGEAADALVADRYLLPADAETLKNSAAAAWSAAIAAPEEDAQ